MTDSDLPHGPAVPEEQLSFCSACNKFFRVKDWEPTMVTCNLGTEHFGHVCPGCKKIRVLKAPHERRPEPDP